MHPQPMQRSSRKESAAVQSQHLLKYALESGTVDAVLTVKKGYDIYDATPVLIKDPAELAELCRFTPLWYSSPSKTHQEIP